MERIPKHKPVYLFSGEKDPVGLHGKGVLNLVSQYKKLQLENIEYRLYPDGRHEMLHEINRTEVAQHVVNWLERNTPGSNTHPSPLNPTETADSI